MHTPLSHNAFLVVHHLCVVWGNVLPWIIFHFSLFHVIRIDFPFATPRLVLFLYLGSARLAKGTKYLMEMSQYSVQLHL